VGCNPQGSYNRFFVQSPEMCQTACTMFDHCNFFTYIPDRYQNCILCVGTENALFQECVDENLDANGWCTGGPAYCPGDEETESPEAILLDAVASAAEFCAGAPDGFDWSNPGANNAPPAPFAGSAAETRFEWTLGLHAVVREWREGVHDSDVGFMGALPTATATAAAAILDGCGQAPCGYGPALVSNARSLLLMYDGNADRALADDATRKAIFQDHSVYVADNGYFDADTLDAIDDFYTNLPVGIMDNGVLGAGTPFATQTVRDAFRCGADDAPGKIISISPVSFNTFQEQLGDRMEDAFSGTTMSNKAVEESGVVRADGLLSVYRHEASHQIDRQLTARQNALKESIKSRCAEDDNWLRAGVSGGDANAFFQGAPQEIIASQWGNQYAFSSATQLEVARRRFDGFGDAIAMEWFVFNTDLAGDEISTTFYAKAQRGYATPVAVGLDRVEPGGAVSRLRVPGCGYFDFAYDSSGHMNGYTFTPGFGLSATDVCVPNTNGSPFPTREPTREPTKNPTPKPSTAPTSYAARGFPKCGAIVMKGNNKDEYFCETDASAGYAFACCNAANQCSRMHPLGTVDGEEGTQTFPFTAFRTATSTVNKNGYCLAQKTTGFKSGGFPAGGQFTAASYFEAKEVCTTYGLQLCGQVPSSNANGVAPHCKGTKCNYDKKMLWTDIPCQAYGSEYSCAPTAAPTTTTTTVVPPTPRPVQTFTFPPTGVMVYKGKDSSVSWCETNEFATDYAIACCKPDETCYRREPEGSNSGCLAGVKNQNFVAPTWAQAAQMCADSGGALCDDAPPPGGNGPRTPPNCKWRGCGYDTLMTWSNVPCPA